MLPTALILQAIELLAEHADLIAELVDVIRSGASKDSIKHAIRGLKLEVSDAAIKEELGL